MDYLLREISEDLWQRFKIQAAKEGRSMREILIELVEDYLLEKE